MLYAYVLTDGSVNVERGELSGWAYSVKVGGVTVSKKPGAVALTISSNHKVIFAYLEVNACKKAVIVTGSKNILAKIRELILICRRGHQRKQSPCPHVKFCLGHSGVFSNESADILVGRELTLDPLQSQLMSKSILLRKFFFPLQTYFNFCWTKMSKLVTTTA